MPAKIHFPKPPLIIWFFSVLLTAWLLSCSGDDTGTGSDGDTTPPTVSFTNPANNAVNISINANITVNFSEAVDSLTVTVASFTVSGGVAGSLSHSSNSATFDPTNPLAYGTTYTVTLTTAIKDLAGNALQANYSWSFTTQVDPNSLPPTVVSTNPVNGAINFDINNAIIATFSKGMDQASFAAGVFTVNNGATGTVSVNGSVVTFTPSDSLAYSTTYTATITTLAADTFGINLAGNYNWSFTTQVDPLVPILAVANPIDSAAIEDTVTIQIDASHPVGLTKMEFYLDGAHLAGDDDLTPPYEYFYDPMAAQAGDSHTFWAIGYEAGGRIGYSDTLRVFYRWMVLASDPNDPWPTDLQRVLARTRDSLLELRFETYGNWDDPYADTSFDLGIYVDVDRNNGTGRLDFDGTALNGIGADYRIIIGFHGGSDAIAQWNEGTLSWETLYDTTRFAYHHAPQNADTLEIAIRWTDLFNSTGVFLMAVNVFYPDQSSILPDFVPDINNGYLVINRREQYYGTPPAPVSAIGTIRKTAGAVKRTNPFE